jgi:hypothetical protein
MWAFDGVKHKEMIFYNITNADAAATGSTPAVQELNAGLWQDHRELGSVDKDALDTTGILTFSAPSGWLPASTAGSPLPTDMVVVPHVVYATMVANGVNVGNPPINEVYPAYYPVLNKVTFASQFRGTIGKLDYVSSTFSTGGFVPMMDPYDSLTSSFYTAERFGLQGLGFVRSIWGGEDQHCGYDSDCMTGQGTNRMTSSSLGSCNAGVGNAGCEPLSLKVGAAGIEYGVSSLKTLPGSSFYEIDKVAPGGENMIFDFTAFSKAGVKFPSINPTYFLLFDVASQGKVGFMSLPALLWKRGAYTMPTMDGGMAFVGPSVSAALPAPLYVSSGKAAGGADVSKCGSCLTHDGSVFDQYYHEQLGIRVGGRDTYTVSVKMGSGTVVPLFLSSEHFATGQRKLIRFFQMDKYLTYTINWDYFFTMIFITIPLLGGQALLAARRICTSGVHLEKESYCS